MNGVWFGKDGTGYIVGGRNKILATYDNGMSWVTVKGSNKPVDLLVFSAHGDDSPIAHGVLMTYLNRVKGKDIAVVHVTRDTHSNEYKGEYYDYECNRSHQLIGAKTVLHFDEFDTGNSGCRSFHINLRLWKGYKEVVRHMVAAIRAYKPKVVLTHDPVFGEYDKPGHKIAGRAGFMAFDEAGGTDRYPELTFLGLEPYQPKKLYTYGTETYPPKYFVDFMGDVKLEGLGETVHQWADRSVRCFQSQGVHFARFTPLHLVKSHVPTPAEEKSIFDGLE